MIISLKRIAVGFAISTAVLAGPQNGQVVNGSGTIEVNGNVVQIEQLTDLLNIDWDSFSIAENESVIFNQPSSSSIAINSVIGSDLSEILGTIQANGQVFLINPNGVLFGDNARVDVGGLLVSDHRLSQNENGELILTPESGSGIINAGQLLSDGNVILLASEIFNSGLIQSSEGDIELIANNDYLVSLNPQGTLWLSVNSESFDDQDTRIEHSGEIHTQQGHIQFNGMSGQDIVDSTINISGNLNVDNLEDPDGVAIDIMADAFLLEGDITVTGDELVNIEANSSAVLNDADVLVTDQANGGQFHLTGDQVMLKGNTEIDASGAQQGGEVWIGGSYQGGGGIENAQYVGVEREVNIDVSATENGDGGEAIVWSDNNTVFYGHVNAQGGAQSGDGGFVEISGKEFLIFDGTASTLAANGERGLLLLDPDFITIGAAGANDTEITADGIIGAAEGSGTYTISQSALEGLSAATDINLAASQGITIDPLTGGVLTLDTEGTVTFGVINTDSTVNNGSASFSMSPTDTIRLTGGASLVIDVQGAANASGNVRMDVGIIDFNGDADAADNVTLTAQNTAPTDGTVAGSVTLNVQEINHSGGAGNITIDALANAGGGVITSGGDTTLTIGPGGINAADDGSVIDLSALSIAADANALIDIDGDLITATTAGSNRIFIESLGGGASDIQLEGTIQTSGGDAFINTADITLTGNTVLNVGTGELNLNPTNSLDGGGFDLELTYGTSMGTFLTNSLNLGSVILGFETSDHIFLGSGTENYLTPLGGAITSYTQATYDALSSSEDVKLISGGSIEVDSLVLSEGLTLEAAGDIYLNDLTGGFELNLDATNIYIEGTNSITDGFSILNGTSIELNDTSITATAFDFGTMPSLVVTGATSSSIISTGAASSIDLTGVAVTETANSDLVLTSQSNVTLGSVNLGSGDLFIDLDQDNSETATLTLTNNVNANLLDVDGSTNNDLMSVSGNLTVSNNIDLANISQLDLNTAAVTTNALVTDGNTNSIRVLGSGANSLGSVSAMDLSAISITETANGDLTLSSDAALTVGQINMGTGDLSLTADANNNGADNLFINNDLTAANLSLNGTTNESVVMANGVDLIADSLNQTGITNWTLNGVVTVDTVSALDVSTQSITSTNTNLGLTSDADISLGAVNLGTGSLTLTADQNNDGNNSISNAGNVTAGDLNLVGSANGDTATLANNVNLTGDLNLTNISALNLNDATVNASNLNRGTTASLVVTGAGASSLSTASALDVSAISVTETADGDLTLSSDDALTTGSINMGAGDITLNADLDNNATNTALTLAGDITASNININGSGNNDDLTQNSNINLLASNDVTLSGIDAWSFNILSTVTSNTLNIGNANSWTLLNDSANAVSISTTSDLDISSATISHTSNGSLTLQSDGNISTGAVNLGIGTLTLNGSQDNAGAETITIAGDVSAGGLFISGGSDANDQVDFQGATLALAGGAASGTLSLNNIDDLSLADGASISVTSFNQPGVNTWTLAGSADVISTNTLNLGSTDITSANGNLSLTSGGDISTGAINLGTSNLTITGDSDDNQTSSLVINGVINANNVTLNGSAANNDSLSISDITAVGALNLNNFSALTLIDNTDLSADSLNQSSVGNWTWGAGTHSLTTNQNLDLANNLTSSGELTLDSVGSVNLGSVNTGVNNLVVNAGTDITLNGDITSGQATLNGGGTNVLTQNAGVDLSPTNGLALTGFNDWRFASNTSVSANSINLGTALNWDMNTLGATSVSIDSANTLDLSAVTLSANTANTDLTLSSNADVSIPVLDLGNGDLVITADANSDGVDSISLAGNVTASLVNLSGSGNETLVLANGVNIFADTLTQSGLSDWTLGGAVAVTTQSALDLSAQTITGTNTNLDLTSTDDVTLNSINIGTGDLTIDVDSDNNGTNTATISGDITSNSLAVNGSGSNDLLNTGGVTLNLTNLNLNGVDQWSLTDSQINLSTFNQGALTQIQQSGTNTASILSQGDLDFTGVSISSLNNGNVSFDSAGSITLDQINLGTGNLGLSIDSNNNGVSNLLVNSTINAGDVTVSGTGSNDVLVQNANISASGSISLNNLSSWQMVDSALQAENLSLASVSGLTLAGAGNHNIILNQTVDLSGFAVTSTNNSNFTLNSNSSVLTDAVNLGTGNLTININSDNSGTDSGTLAGNLAAGSISINGSGADIVNLNGATVDSDALSLSSLGELNLADGLVLTTGTLNNNNVSSWNAVGSAEVNTVSGNLDVSSSQMSAVNNLTLNSSDDLSVADVDVQGNLILAADTDNTGGAAISLSGTQSASGLQISGASGNSTELTGTVSQNIGSNGVQVVNLDNLNWQGDLTSEGNIEINIGGDFIMTDGSSMFTESSLIDIQSGGDMTIAALRSNRSDGTAISLIAGGNILDGGDADIDVWADNENLVVMNAANLEQARDELEYSFDFAIPELPEFTEEELADLAEQGTNELSPEVVEENNEQEQILAKNQEAEANSVDSAFSQCRPDDKSPECQVMNALESFAGSLLVGGELPE